MVLALHVHLMIADFLSSDIFLHKLPASLAMHIHGDSYCNGRTGGEVTQLWCEQSRMAGPPSFAVSTVVSENLYLHQACDCIFGAPN